MTLSEALGAEVRAEAAAQRLTVAELAHKANVNRSSLYTWLDAKAAFPVNGLAALAATLRIEPHVLIRRAEERTRRDLEADA